VRPRPARLDRLPQQYFTALLARVAEAAKAEGEPLIDLGRGNPEVGPPQHVIDRLTTAAGEERAHGYPPFRGLPELWQAFAER
jgi:L-glutamine---4-(methylsulfanyl)-2-oxobutanoate aminotransferase